MAEKSNGSVIGEMQKLMGVTRKVGGVIRKHLETEGKKMGVKKTVCHSGHGNGTLVEVVFSGRMTPENQRQINTCLQQELKPEIAPILKGIGVRDFRIKLLRRNPGNEIIDEYRWGIQPVLKKQE